jgi:cyclic-di-AMP phosphodiesterase PgpH
MDSLLTKIKKNYKQAGTLLVFGIAFIIISLLMPGERRLSYDFFKGKPWVHEDFTAPFDFPIYKTNEQLKVEQDSALKDLRYYFTYNSAEFPKYLANFNDGFELRWIEYSLQEFAIPDTYEYNNNPKYLHLHELQKSYRTILNSFLEKVYYKGVLEMPDTGQFNLNQSSTIVVVKGNIASEMFVSDLFTPKTAYEYVNMKINDDPQLKSDPHYISFLSTFPFNHFIFSNITYNHEATERERSVKLESVSLTSGMIQEGELIVSKGEIISQQKYQVLQSLKIEFENEKGNIGYRYVKLGKLVILIVALMLIYLFLYNFRREVLRDYIKTGFILFLITLMIFIATITAQFESISFYLIPFAILPILLRTFFDERVAIFIHVITTLIIGLIAPNSYEFVVLTIMAGLVGIFSLSNQYRRSKFFISALFIVITYCLTYFGISVIQEGSFLLIDWRNFGYFGLNGVLVLVSFLLIYVFEKAFGLLSDTTLIELSDTNQPLLRKMAEVAPGTFQHSLQVANLSEEAIYQIGGNPLLVRTGALYHDIGKIVNPIYYIENQATGINPHDNLEFSESAKIIISHVVSGTELARKNNLPQSIINFISTHHGTSTVNYFYRSYIKKYPSSEVNIKNFTYPGPKPITKEMVVLMMADSVEAASRSLTEYSHNSISMLVEDIINDQLSEGQFSESAISFREIKTVKEVFITRLKNIYHARISYPKIAAGS